MSESVPRESLRALDVPAAHPEAPRRRIREKRVLMGWEEERSMEQLAAELSAGCHTPVHFSNILRACMLLLRHSQAAIRRHADPGAMPLNRPAYSDPAAMAAFEQRLAALIQAGLQDSPRISS